MLVCSKLVRTQMSPQLIRNFSSAQLPRLPVPALHDTLNKFLRLVIYRFFMFIPLLVPGLNLKNVAVEKVKQRELLVSVLCSSQTLISEEIMFFTFRIHLIST